MKRIDTATKAVDLYGVGKHGFQDGDPDIGQAPTGLNASWFNQVQEELARIVEGAGVALDGAKVNQIATLLGPLVFVAPGGTANALTVALPAAIAPAAYADQQKVRVKVAAANTRAMTINVSDLGAKSIVHADGSEMGYGELKAGQFVELIYSAGLGKFVIVGSPTRGRFTRQVVITTSMTFDPADYGVEDYWFEGVAAGASGATPSSGGTAVEEGGGAGFYAAGFLKVTAPIPIVIGSPGAVASTPSQPGAHASDTTIGDTVTLGGGRYQSASTGVVPAGWIGIPGQRAMTWSVNSGIGLAGHPAALGIGGWDPQGYGAGGLGGRGYGAEYLGSYGAPATAGRPSIVIARF